MGVWRTGRRWLRATLLATATVAVPVHLATAVTDLTHLITSSIHRPAAHEMFAVEYGTPISAWQSDISSLVLQDLAEVFAKEQAEMPFSLNTVRITPTNYFRSSFLEQAKTIVLDQNVGMYNPVFDGISISPGDDFVAHAHHEIKHAKMFAVFWEHPELKDRWEVLALDNNDESMYVPFVKRLVSRVRLLEFFVKDNEYSAAENFAAGFVSNYARSDFFEDVAELGEFIASSPESPDPVHAFTNQTNVRFREKVVLAQEYHLVPQEFSHFAQAMQTYEQGNGHHGVQANDFLDESGTFIAENPQSRFTPYLHQLRAQIFLRRQNQSQTRYADASSQARMELLCILAADYKDPGAYKFALETLANTFEKARSPFGHAASRVLVFSEAYDEYNWRNSMGDVTLTSNGVNEYLRENGVHLPSTVTCLRSVLPRSE